MEKKKNPIVADVIEKYISDTLEDIGNCHAAVERILEISCLLGEKARGHSNYVEADVFQTRNNTVILLELYLELAKIHFRDMELFAEMYDYRVDPKVKKHLSEEIHYLKTCAACNSTTTHCLDEMMKGFYRTPNVVW